MLTEEQRLIRDTARDFAREQLAPFAAERDREAKAPMEVLHAMGRLGLMGMTVAPEWGGAGADFLSYVLAMEEIAAGDGGISTIMSVNNSPVCAAIETYGSEAQKRQWLTKVARGEAMGAFLLTEPHAGSDASNLKTRARRDGNGWRLSGVKQFITSGSIADIAMVFAASDPAAGKRGISCFLVPTDSEGWKVAAVEKKLGQRTSDTCQILLEDVFVPADMMLGREGEGYRIALANLESGRIGIAAQAVGMARAAFETAHAYAREREAFGIAIVNHQAVAFRLADMATQIEAAHQMVLNAARLKDAKAPCLKEASMAKLFASEMAEKVCSAAIQIHGGYGYLEGKVERIYRDVRVCQIYEGTSDVQRIVISRALAGDA
ncbi:acyl-CoA dehydrogenase family protein [Desertibaculum subflavum]|uniref:acyl-CoA dehydrogenase family protein n=1 Tax=Desertibaculum subflavum TaxID=2268458 RepID=UPI000E668E0D